MILDKHLSVRELDSKIKSKEYERLPETTKDKEVFNKNNTITDFVKNPILIKNTNKSEMISEKVLQKLTLTGPHLASPCRGGRKQTSGILLLPSLQGKGLGKGPQIKTTMLKVKANEKLQKIGKYEGTYRYIMMPELYTTLGQQKVTAWPSQDWAACDSASALRVWAM